jgi:hypothetical protein
LNLGGSAFEIASKTAMAVWNGVLRIAGAVGSLIVASIELMAAIYAGPVLGVLQGFGMTLGPLEDMDIAGTIAGWILSIADWTHRLAELIMDMWVTVGRVAGVVIGAILQIPIAIANGVAQVFASIKQQFGGSKIAAALVPDEIVEQATTANAMLSVFSDALLAGQNALKVFELQLTETVVRGAYDNYLKMWGSTDAVPKTDKDAADKAAKKRKHTVYDFRNSRFDIMQKFADGFDPDRIAAVFTDDLAKLAEMRTMSGVAPLFGV